MERLNYFNPFLSKSENHEDRLTRSFLVLLKYSPSCYFFFYETIIEKCSDIKLPSLKSQINEDIQFKTQVTNIQFETEKLISLLITNDDLKPNNKIVPKGRSATYDGVISIGDKLSIIIETKPNKNDVWEDQLCPSIHNVSEDIEIIEKPIVITWFSIISWLNEFSFAERYPYSERQVANDFLSFVNSQYSYLNPFNRYVFCKGNTALILKRTENILKSIVNDESIVRNHKGWGYYIDTSCFSSIRKIGLIYNHSKKNLDLSLYYGDTQGQAKSYYPTNVSINDFKNCKWIVYGNFHLATVASNLVYFHTKELNLEKYISYWNKNAPNLKQVRGHQKLKEYLQPQYENSIILRNDDMLQKRVLDTNIKNINICPGVGFIYRYNLSEIENIDIGLSMQKDLIEKIRYCIKSNINEECHFLKTI